MLSTDPKLDPFNQIEMRFDESEFLNLRRLPGRINAEQAASLLGVPPGCIPILVRYKFLEPLGNDVKPNAPKQFASVRIVELTQDKKEMHRMQVILTRYWKGKNEAKTQGVLVR